MIVTATEFKNKVGKYLELSNKEEIIIARNGKQIAKLIPVDKQTASNIDGLLEVVKNAKKTGSSINTKENIREERLKKYENLT